MNLKQMMEAALKAAREIALKAKSEGRDPVFPDLLPHGTGL